MMRRKAPDGEEKLLGPSSAAAPQSPSSGGGNSNSNVHDEDDVTVVVAGEAGAGMGTGGGSGGRSSLSSTSAHSPAPPPRLGEPGAGGMLGRKYVLNEPAASEGELLENGSGGKGGLMEAGQPPADDGSLTGFLTRKHRGVSLYIWLTAFACVMVVLFLSLYAGGVFHSTSNDDDDNSGSGSSSGSGKQEYDTSLNSNVYVVESLPVGQFNLELVPGGKNSWQAMVQLLDNAQSTVDISVMYWSLNATATDPEYSQSQLDAMGAQQGMAVLNALYAAADRGVKIRILQNNDTAQFGPQTELWDLVAAYPNQVSYRPWNAEDWYAGGIMHMKIWVADSTTVYVGSANMDWLSFSQVKELGVMVVNNSLIGADLQNMFNMWWAWGGPDAVDDIVVEGHDPVSWYFNPSFQNNLTVPCWSHHLSTTDSVAEAFGYTGFRGGQPCNNPLLDLAELYDPDLDPSRVSQQYDATLNNTACSWYISGAPQEVLNQPTNSDDDFDDDTFLALLASTTSSVRTWDQSAIVSTILDAEEFVYLSVMDFIPTSIYSGFGPTGLEPLWWHDFTDALLTVAISKGVTVRLLISYWAHTNAQLVPYLQALNKTGAACDVHDFSDAPHCSGSVEIRLFEVPGWNDTGSSGNEAWPAYSRVNHAKYVVTDRRANVGTSNYVFSYMYQTAGASFNSDNEPFRSSVQAVFDRDWDSNYVYTLDQVKIH